MTLLRSCPDCVGCTILQFITSTTRQDKEVREAESRRGGKTCSDSLLHLISHILFHATRNSPGRKHIIPPPTLWRACHVESVPQRGSNAPLLLMRRGLGTVLSRQLSKISSILSCSVRCSRPASNHASVAADRFCLLHACRVSRPPPAVALACPFVLCV